jgi:hypothetical protein
VDVLIGGRRLREESRGALEYEPWYFLEESRTLMTWLQYPYNGWDFRSSGIPAAHFSNKSDVVTVLAGGLAPAEAPRMSMADWSGMVLGPVEW